MKDPNLIIILELMIFSGIAIVFAAREIWLLTPEQQAKEEIKAQKRKEKYEREEALRASRHTER
jgi:hypothetical protein